MPQLRTTRNVAVVTPPWDTGHETELAQRAAAYLRQLGVQAQVLNPGRCGWIAWTDGNLQRARREAYTWLQTLREQETVVIPSPTCVFWLQRICPQLLNDHADAAVLAAEVRDRTWEWHAFIAAINRAPIKSLEHPPPAAVLFPGCHAWAMPQLVSAIQMVLRQAGVNVTHTVGANVCCGADGPISKVFPDLATAVHQRTMYAILRHHPTVVVVPEVRCFRHVQGGLYAAGWHGRVLHTVELLTG